MIRRRSFAVLAALPLALSVGLLAIAPARTAAQGGTDVLVAPFSDIAGRVSVGRPSNGYLRDGHRLPDRGEGFMTRDPWRLRGNRFGTDELLDMITGVGRRISEHKGPRLVVADLVDRRVAANEPAHVADRT